MNYFFMQRWLASKEKLEGKTIRKSPSEQSWELAILDDNKLSWYRLASNPFEEPTFAGALKVDQSAAKAFVNKLKPRKTFSIKPGEFLNDTKETLVFIRLAGSGNVQVLEDNRVKRFKIGKTTLVFEPRRGVEGQYRVNRSRGPGEEMEVEKFQKAPKLECIETDDDTVTLKNVPIAKAGIWNGIPITPQILSGLKARFEKLRDKLFVPLKLEHSGVKESEERTHLGPALGWLTKVYLFGDALYGDFIKVPKAVARLIKNGQYIGVSPEIARTFEGTPDVLVGVALLGAALPAMTTLPKLLTLYAESQAVESVRPPIPLSVFGGNMGKTETKVQEVFQREGSDPSSDVLFAMNLCFQRKTAPDQFADVLGMLQGKKYPKTLAEEMIELLPDPTVEKADVIPEYTLEMVEQRVGILADRAKQPEFGEKVILEIEETLEIFKDDLAKDENKELKAKLEKTLAIAKEHKGTTELEEAIEKETPKKEEYPKAEEAAEKYPQEPSNVKIDMEKLSKELKARALGLVKATVEKFEAAGWDKVRCGQLSDLLTQLDSALTPNPDTNVVRTLLFQVLGGVPRSIETFQNFTTPETDETDFVDVLVGATKRSRIARNR